MSDCVRYIHTQAQAQDELERQRLTAQERYARLKRRRQLIRFVFNERGLKMTRGLAIESKNVFNTIYCTLTL